MLLLHDHLLLCNERRRMRRMKRRRKKEKNISRNVKMEPPL